MVSRVLKTWTCSWKLCDRACWIKSPSIIKYVNSTLGTKCYEYLSWLRSQDLGIRCSPDESDISWFRFSIRHADYTRTHEMDASNNTRYLSRMLVLLLYRSRNILCQVFVYCEREDHCRQLRDSRGNLICALISTKGCDDYWFVQSVFDICFYWCLRGTRIRAYVVESFEVCTTIWRDPGESLGRASKLDENSIYKFLRKYCFLLWYSIQHCLSC